MKQKTELQKAADRVASINAAIGEYEEELKKIQATHDAAWIEYQAAYRDLEDTKSLLRAQREKLEREKESALQSIHAAEGYYATNGMNNGYAISDKIRRY